ncbi:MAG: TonB-dependent receptor, partial [Caulobacteraceae bacterium]|nr:TonB-dependent receptor [Caulobacteraceae bacterium]
MNHSGRIRRARSCASARVLALLSSACVITPAAGHAQTSLGEVVVTARRAEESLQTTPVAVTALGADAIEKAQIRTVLDIQSRAPGLNIATGSPGTTGLVLLAIRGQGALRTATSADPAVATYVDGVYIPRPTQGMTELNDLERIEVLRGPQGTLFGRNTTGGAINIISAVPKDYFEMIAKAEVGDYSYRSAGLTVNAPLADGL